MHCVFILLKKCISIKIKAFFKMKNVLNKIIEYVFLGALPNLFEFNFRECGIYIHTEHDYSRCPKFFHI